MLKKTFRHLQLQYFCTSQEEPKLKQIPNAKYQIDKFQSLQHKLVQSTKRTLQLQKQIEFADIARIVTVSDHCRKAISKVTGSKFETAAVKKLRQQLLIYRNQLEKQIEESSFKWQLPRQRILTLRKQLLTDFISRFVRLEDKMEIVVRTNQIENSELKEGTELTYRMLISALSKHGVQFYTPNIGTKYNEQQHETADIQQMKQDNLQILSVLSNGWKIDGRVIKKANVKLK